MVAGIRAKLPESQDAAAGHFDQATQRRIRSSCAPRIEDVVQEMVTAAILAGLAVLLFVGSWRSTLIVAASIPLSILSSIIVLSALGRPSTS